MGNIKFIEKFNIKCQYLHGLCLFNLNRIELGNYR